MKEGKGKFIFFTLVFTAIYFIAGKIGLYFSLVHSSVSAIWPPAGVAAAILILKGRKYWPFVLIGAFLVNISVQGVDFPASVGISLGNTLEALVVATLMKRFGGGKKFMEKPKNIVLFTLFAVAGSIVAATFGTSSLSLSGNASWDNYSHLWGTWLIGDMMGMLILTPFIISWSIHEEKKHSHNKSIIAIIILIVISSISFLPASPLALHNYPISYLPIIPILWLALNSCRKLVSLGIIVLSAIAIYGTMNGAGAFSLTHTNGSLIFLQGYLGTMSILKLIIYSSKKN